MMTAKRIKSQVWYTDFIIALMIFVIVLVIYYKFVVNLSEQDRSAFEELVSDSKMISSSLVSGGFPENWTNTTVQRIGITDNNYRVMQSKVNDIERLGYKKTRVLFGTKFDYFASFEDRSRCLVNITAGFGLGYNVSIINSATPKNCTIQGAQNKELNISGLNKDDIVKVTRLLVYGDDIVRMVVHVWQ